MQLRDFAHCTTLLGPGPRCMPRFAVPQKGDWRSIDDGKTNGANAATRMVETVTTPSFFFPAIVGRGFVDAAPYWSYRFWIQGPVTLGMTC